MRRIAFLLTSLSLFVPLAASAQFTGVTPLTLSVYPAYPHPNQTVTITPNSTIVNLSSLTLNWTVNGKSAGKSSGSAPLQAQTGGPGTKMKVSVTAGSYSASLTISPSDVELVAEPQTTVHPLYEGGHLIGSQSPIRLIAMADVRDSAGTRIKPSSLVYNWRLGDQALQPQSGIGANTLGITGPVLYRDATIFVTVSGQDGTIYGEDSYALTPVAPTLRLYVNDPLQGPLYNMALGSSFVMPNVESSFIAVPYSFSAMPNIAWTIGGQPSSQGAFVTVRSTGSGAGNAVVAAHATNGTLESAGAQSAVSFQSTDSGGILKLLGL
jgi:hypothetical protein